MPERILSRAEVRSVDRIAIEELGMPGIVLMENAGRGCAELLLREKPTGLVCLCCGHGNNGGDGFVVARHLENNGVACETVLFSDPGNLTGDAAVNFRILKNSQARLRILDPRSEREGLSELLKRSEWIVDALLGTGVSGEIREPYVSLIECINEARKPVLAVDLPSGLDCDSGLLLGPCIRATLTATFVARKPGFLKDSAQPYLGQVHVVDIGVPQGLLTRMND